MSSAVKRGQEKKMCSGHEIVYYLLIGQVNNQYVFLSVLGIHSAESREMSRNSMHRIVLRTSPER